MKHKTLKQGKDGEWIQPLPKGYLLGCCDCGLIHRLNFRIVKGRVQFQAFRAPKYTSFYRKKLGIILRTSDEKG